MLSPMPNQKSRLSYFFVVEGLATDGYDEVGIVHTPSSLVSVAFLRAR